MSIPGQPVLPTRTVTQNCKFDSTGISNDVKNNRSIGITTFRMYDSVQNPDEYMIGFGEPCFARKGPGSYRNEQREIGPQPIVRSFLNGFLVQPEVAMMQKIQAERDATHRMRLMELEFMKCIQYVGVSIKNTFHDGPLGTDVSDPPVVAQVGLVTMTNTGNVNIETGNMVVLTLPNPTMPQLNPVKNNPFLKSSPQRKVLCTTPMNKATYAIDLVRLRRFTAVVKVFTDVIAAANDEQTDVPNVAEADYARDMAGQHQENRLKELLNESFHDKFSKRVERMKGQVKQELRAAKELEARDDVGNAKMRSEYYARLATDPEIAQMFRDIVAPMRDEINQLMNFMIGIAQTSAAPGAPFEINLRPAFNI